MKPKKQTTTLGKISKRLSMEDMRYLQKKISGKSVYKSLRVSYLRKPKHKSIEYQY